MDCIIPSVGSGPITLPLHHSARKHVFSERNQINGLATVSIVNVDASDENTIICSLPGFGFYGHVTGPIPPSHAFNRYFTRTPMQSQVRYLLFERK